MRLSNVDTRELVGFKDKLICHFILAMGMVGGGIWEFVNDTEGPEFLEREMMGLGVVQECWSFRVIHISTMSTANMKSHINLSLNPPIARYQHLIASLDLPHPYFPFSS